MRKNFMKVVIVVIGVCCLSILAKQSLAQTTDPATPFSFQTNTGNIEFTSGLVTETGDVYLFSDSPNITGQALCSHGGFGHKLVLSIFNSRDISHSTIRGNFSLDDQNASLDPDCKLVGKLIAAEKLSAESPIVFNITNGTLTIVSFPRL